MTTTQEAPRIPDFGGTDTSRKLAIICSKGNLDMAYPGLVLANAALGGLPGMTALATHQMRKTIADLGIPDVPEFLQQIVDSGGHLWACRMSADMQHLELDDLYDAVEGIISASDFIEKTEGAQLLFI
jgi:peroxiredoxin family protein